MPLKSKRSPAEGEFLFEIDEQPTEECLTALGGVPLFVRTARSLDVPGSVQRNLALKQRDRGFDEATYIESFLVLNARWRGLFGRLRLFAGRPWAGGHAGTCDTQSRGGTKIPVSVP